MESLLRLELEDVGELFHRRPILIDSLYFSPESFGIHLDGKSTQDPGRAAPLRVLWPVAAPAGLCERYSVPDFLIKAPRVRKIWEEFPSAAHRDDSNVLIYSHSLAGESSVICNTRFAVENWLFVASRRKSAGAATDLGV